VVVIRDDIDDVATQMVLSRFDLIRARRGAPIYVTGVKMRKFLIGAVALTALIMLTAPDASAAQSNGVNHAALPHSVATDVYYHRHWHHRHWHHRRRWHHRY
jgi:hypothetical protein